jgi:sugar-phosphatase
VTSHQAIRAVIFDMDGVIIDSEPFWQKAEVQVFARFGIHLTHATCRETMGMRIDEVVAYRMPPERFDSSTLELAAAAIVDSVIDQIRADGTALPGLYEVIEYLDGLGAPLGLASSSPPRLIKAVLDHLQLTETFAVVQSAAEVQAGKPAPDVYLQAAARLGVEPRSCLAIEDSAAGITSAHRAGCQVLAVPGPDPLDAEALQLASLVVGSLAELDLDQLLRRGPVSSGAAHLG